MDGHEDYGYEEAQDYPFEEVAGSGDENRIRGNWYDRLELFSLLDQQNPLQVC